MTTHRKDEIGTDSEGRYRRYIGWKLGTGRLVQHLFRFGKNQQQATLLNSKVESLWEAVVARWQRLKARGFPTDTTPLWDDTTLEIGRCIARGDSSCTVIPPTGMEDLDAERLVVWLDGLQRDFPIIPLKLPESRKYKQVYEAGQEKREEEAQELDGLATAYKSAARSIRGQGGVGTVRLALQSFREHVRRKYGDVGHGKSFGNQVQFLIDNTQDVPLSALTGDKLLEWVEGYRRRPQGKRGQLSHSYCVNLIKAIRYFVKWLDGSEEYEWELPRNFKFGKVKVENTSKEMSARVRTDTVKRFTVEELATLWEYALPVERVYLALGLNCGFSRAEMATLMLDEVFLDHKHPKFNVKANWIKRLRRKTSVYGEWILWPVTVQAVEWVQRNRPKTDDGHLLLNKKGKPLDGTTKGGNANNQILSLWQRLYKRVKKDHPDFKTLGLKYLRKTGASMVRHLRGGEVSSLYLAHGPASDTEDKLLAVYANRPFGKLHKTLRKLGRKLQVAVFAKVSDPFPEKAHERRPEISLGKIKRIKELVAQGYKVAKVAEMTGTSQTTVRRYTGKKASQPSETQ